MTTRDFENMPDEAIDLTLAGPETFMSPACKAADVSDADVYGVTEFGILPMGKLGDIENLEI